jgi:hypothetical protein
MLVNFILQWCRRIIAYFTPWAHGFDPGLIHVKFVVNKVALKQSFLLEEQVFLRQNYSTYVPFPSLSEHNSCQKDGRMKPENL